MSKLANVTLKNVHTQPSIPVTLRSRSKMDLERDSNPRLLKGMNCEAPALPSLTSGSSDFVVAIFKTLNSYFLLWVQLLLSLSQK